MWPGLSRKYTTPMYIPSKRKDGKGVAGIRLAGSSVLIAVSAVSIAFPAHADDVGPALSLRGFGTVGVVHSNTREGDYVASTQQASGAGFSHRWAAGVDSKAGLQLDAKLSERLSAALQVVSLQRPDKTYAPRAEWANLKYQFHPDFSIRVGRVLLPILMEAESRLVGYANPWVRPPIEIYNLAEITRSDGFDASYRSRFGGVSNNVQVFFGRQNQEFVSSSFAGTQIVPVRLRHITGIADTMEVGPWTLRTGIFTSKASYSGNEGRVNFYTVGAARDTGVWFIQGEWGVADSKLRIMGQEMPRRRAYYVTSGYRWGAFTPYLTWSRIDSSGTSTVGRIIEQQSTSAGVRWDIARNMAIKTQFGRVDVDGAGGTGYFVNLQPGFPAGGKVSVVSIALDFVF